MDVAHGRTIAAACSVADAMKTGSPLGTSETDALIASLGGTSRSDTTTDLIQIFQPYIRGCDWPRYLSENALPLHGLTDDERDALASNRAESSNGRTENDDLAIAEFHQRWSEHLDWAADEDPLVRRLETLIGLDTEVAFGIAEAVGRTTDAFLTLPDIPEQLRESLPAAVPIRADRPDYPRFLHNLLRAIGPGGRSERGVVRLCGRQLDMLFPDEVDPERGTYRYRQARILLEERLACDPYDLDALAWTAELCCRAGDQQEAATLAERLWVASERCEPSHLARLVQFSLGHSWDYREPIFDRSSDYFGLMGSLEEEWLDREEPLATALLRRAFDNGKWNADLVQTIIEFDCGVIDISDDIMPWNGWVWGALRSAPSGMYYYKQWSRALAAAEASHDGLGVALAVPALIAGVIRKRCQEQYTDWLKSLRSCAITPGERRAAAKAVSGLKNVANELPPSARVSLERLAQELAAEMEASSEAFAVEAVALATGLRDVAAQEPLARNHLGDSLWERLSAQTRCHILQTLGVFHYFQLTPVDTVGYGIVFVELANAILCEVDVQFSTALRLPRWSVFRDWNIRDALGSEYSRSLGSLPHLFNLFGSPNSRAVCNYATDLRVSGVHIDTLIHLIPDIEQLVEARNPGAHAGIRIDREWAKNLYNQWFVKGILRELFEAMHPQT